MKSLHEQPGGTYHEDEDAPIYDRYGRMHRTSRYHSGTVDNESGGLGKLYGKYPKCSGGSCAGRIELLLN